MKKIIIYMMVCFYGMHVQSSQPYSSAFSLSSCSKYVRDGKTYSFIEKDEGEIIDQSCVYFLHNPREIFDVWFRLNHDVRAIIHNLVKANEMSMQSIVNSRMSDDRKQQNLTNLYKQFCYIALTTINDNRERKEIVRHKIANIGKEEQLARNDLYKEYEFWVKDACCKQNVLKTVQIHKEQKQFSRAVSHLFNDFNDREMVGYNMKDVVSENY